MLPSPTSTAIVTPSSTPTPAPTATPTPSPTATPIPITGPPLKVGVLLPYSKGPTQVGEDIIAGMSLYFDSGGGIVAGRKVELVKEDEESDPQVTAQKARKLIEQDKVDVLTGLAGSGAAASVRDVAHSSKAILLISNASANELSRARKSPYVFRTSFSNWQLSWALGAWVAKNVAKKVFVSASDDADGKEMVAGFKQTFIPAGGTVDGELFSRPGGNDYAAHLARIAQAKPGAAFIFYGGNDAVGFVKQYDQQGLKKDTKITGPGRLTGQHVLPAQGKAALGAITTLYWAQTLDNPENKKFVADYRRKYGREPSSYSVQGHDTARAIAEALAKTAGDTSDKEKLAKALEGVRFRSPRGSFQFDPTSHNVVQDIYIREVKEVGGKLVNVAIDSLRSVKDPGK